MTAPSANVYSEEKAQRLVQTFRGSLAFSFLIVWFEMVILRPSGDMEKEMVGVDMFLGWVSVSGIDTRLARTQFFFPAEEIHSFNSPNDLFCFVSWSLARSLTGWLFVHSCSAYEYYNTQCRNTWILRKSLAFHFHSNMLPFSPWYLYSSY